jgi:hypothetical protein
LGGQQIIFVRELQIIIPELPIYCVAELKFEKASQIRLELLELDIDTTCRLAGGTGGGHF